MNYYRSGTNKEAYEFMNPKPSLEESYKLIRQAMKQQGVTYVTLGQQLDHRTEKLSVAVRCTTGVTPSTIKLRKRIAAALGLDPYKVWSSEYLEYSGRKAYSTAPYTVRAARSIPAEQWDELPPRMRVRALCKDRGIDLAYLQDKLEVTYRVLTAAIYGAKMSDHIREKIAEELETPIAEIWPDLYSPKFVKASQVAKTVAKKPDLNAFFGFGSIV